MEHTSDMVYDGKLIHENSYLQRAAQQTEVQLSIEWHGISLTGKVDYYDKKDNIIHETKRSNKVEVAHEWQVKFYIWLFTLNGMEGVRGRIEYPLLRQTTDITLSNDDIEYLKTMIPKIVSITSADHCHETINSKICKRCSYYDFCYVEE